ncbi:replicative DNA helicase [Clostridium aciditolerans]|uniref:DNA 5'-3' helicase n=1 Tax=Clostridium aciditolerans TaxID=339861 RepID=A0A934I232_9CLOT|nr:replicative DNA helicase [Clostridium aciditolerans]MBI6873611.1 replicative DNA helicase [Clostridium aciditolerans]
MNLSNISNIEAELSVIGAILVKNDAICEVINFLKPEDFYDLKNGIIYKNLKELYESNIPIDIITLAERLKDTLKEIGGITYLSKIINSTVTSKGIKEHGEIVKEKASCREFLKILNSSLDKLSKGEFSSEHLISYTQNSLINAKSLESRDTGRVEKIMESFMDTLQTRYENGGDIQGIKSGYKLIDRMLGGLSKEDLIILAARPSMGKTAMAINLLLNTVLKQNAKTAFFNLEMGIKQIVDRVVSIHTAIPMNSIKNASLTEEQWYDVTKSASILAQSSIKMYDKILTLASIKAECRRLKIKEGLDIVVIDYLQLIDSEERQENRNQDISKITRSLKLMAKELDITVIILSQLSRAPECRSDHRPLLSDLRESGSIEQDADIVLFLYRDECATRS